MARTRHGHHIPNSTHDGVNNSLVEGCGGPGLCAMCQADVIGWHLENSPENHRDKLVDVEHELITHFAYDHLHPKLQNISRPFGELAKQLDDILVDDSQKDLALTHLLQAKDAAVRSYLTHLRMKERT